MTTARVDYDSTTPFGKKLALVFQFGTQFRQYVAEVNQEALAFAGDTTSFATKTGIASGSCQAVLDQLARMNGEINGTILTGADLAAGATSYTKTILDRMA